MTRRPTLAALAVTAVLLSACGTSETASGNDEGAGDSETVVVGSANFPESEIIGNLYAQALEAAGFTVETRFGIGSREAYIPALQDGSIDLIPEYTGNLLTYLTEDTSVVSAADIEAALPDALAERDLTMLEPAEAQDSDAIVVTAKTAKDWGLTTIGDLAGHNDQLVIAGPPEMSKRPAGLPGLEKNYGVKPTEFMPINDGGGPATVKALVGGKATAANIFSTSPALHANDLVTLEDPENNFPAQNVVPVLTAEPAAEQELVDALNEVSAELTTEDLIALNTAVSGDQKQEPEQAAKEWLQEKGLR